MDFLNNILPLLIVFAVVLFFMGAMAKAFWPLRCPNCGKRAVRQRKGGCCSKGSCCDQHQGKWVCDLCESVFSDRAEVLAGAPRDPDEAE